MMKKIIVNFILLVFLYLSFTLNVDATTCNGTNCSATYGTYYPSSDSGKSIYPNAGARASYVETKMTEVLNQPWINENNKTIVEFMSGAVTTTRQASTSDSTDWSYSYGVGYVNSYAKAQTYKTGINLYFTGGHGGSDAVDITKLKNGDTATGWGYERQVRPLPGNYEFIVKLQISNATKNYLATNNLKIKSIRIAYLTNDSNNVSNSESVTDKLYYYGIDTFYNNYVYCATSGCNKQISGVVDYLNTSTSSGSIGSVKYGNSVLKNTLTSSYLLKYSIKYSDIDSEKVTISSDKTYAYVKYSATLFSNFVNTVSDLYEFEPANGMGLNTKYGTKQDASDKSLATTFYEPFVIELTYESNCDTTAAGDANSTDFSNYWKKNGIGNNVTYSPTSKMMDCTCEKDSTGATYANQDFSVKYRNDTSGATSTSSKVAANNLKVSCKGYGTQKACTLDNYKAGNLTTDETKACCDANATGFTGSVCPQDTTFDLYCNAKTTDTKTYVSYDDELDNNNPVCAVNCTETATPIFAKSPSTLAGQGFNYDWKLNMSQSCTVNYSKMTSAAYITQLNKLINDRITKYNASVVAYNNYLAQKATYDSYSKRCSTTYKVCHSNACCTGRAAYTTCSGHSAYTTCSGSGKKQTCTTHPSTRSCTDHASTCKSNDCCTSTQWCNDPNITVADYNSQLSTYRSNRDAAKAAYDAANSTYQTSLSLESVWLGYKKTCDGWASTTAANGDFSLAVTEGGDTSTYDYNSKITSSTNNISSSASVPVSAYYTCATSNPKATNIAQCPLTSQAYYSTLTRLSTYTIAYTYPDTAYIDKATGVVSNSQTDSYYNGGNNYYTQLKTNTGQYDLTVIQNNKGFGAYEEFNLKDFKMPCWYDLSNDLAPSSTDINHDKYGSFGLEFRVVKLTNLFPNRSPGTNWASSNNLIAEIEKTGYTIYSSKDPLYTVELTPALMSEIRQYNAAHKYSDWNGFNFNTGTSSFLTNIMNSGVIKL